MIQLQEIGADGTVSSEIAETTVENIQGAPVGFSLRYDARNLVPDHRYVINATISEGQHRLLELPQGQPVYVGHLPKSVLLVLDRAAPSAAGKPNH